MADDVALAAVEWDEVTGRITLRFGHPEETYVLRPPLVGERRQLDEFTERAAEQIEAKRTAAQQAVDDGVEGAEPYSPNEYEVLCDNLRWWALAFELLCDRPLPEPDLCPDWLGTVPMMVRARMHWRSFPIPALGTSLLALLGAQSNGAAE